MYVHCCIITGFGLLILYLEVQADSLVHQGTSNPASHTVVIRNVHQDTEMMANFAQDLHTHLA